MKFKIPYLSRLLAIKETQLILEDRKLEQLEKINKKLNELIKLK